MSDNFKLGNFLDPVTVAFKAVTRRAIEVSSGVFRDVISAPEGVIASANFTPPGASIAAGNIIDTAKEFAFTYANGEVIPDGMMIRVTSVIMKISASALISGEGAYTLRTYNVTPPSARATNTAWARAAGDLSAYRGKIDVGTPVAEGGTCYVRTQLSDQQDFHLTSKSLFAELTNAGTFVGVATARQMILLGMVL